MYDIDFVAEKEKVRGDQLIKIVSETLKIDPRTSIFAKVKFTVGDMRSAVLKAFNAGAGDKKHLVRREDTVDNILISEFRIYYACTTPDDEVMKSTVALIYFALEKSFREGLEAAGARCF